MKSPYEAAGGVDILSMSIAIDPYDPFDDDLVAKFLRRLPRPISSYANYVPMDQNLPVIRANTNIELGEWSKFIIGINCHRFSEIINDFATLDTYV